MSNYKGFKVATLAASIALAMASTAAMAANPTATQLPGAGVVAAGTAVAGTAAAGVQTIAVTGNAVINWGVASGATLNTTQPGGFNVGSAAKLTFDGTVPSGATAGTLPGSVLNVDVSGNASQIFGQLSSVGGGNLYVANANGIIVGATAQISSEGNLGLIANTRGTVAFDGTASKTSIEYQGSGGTVTVAKGAFVNSTGDTGTVLISGGGVVNVDLSAFNGGALTLEAGVKNSSSTLVNDNTAAVLTAAGDLGGATLVGFASAGSASTAGTLALSGGVTRVDGTLTNTGTLTLGDNIKGGLVNSSKLALGNDVSVGSLVNNGALDGADGELGYGLTTSKGGITNNGQITIFGALISNGAFTNAGQIAASGVDVIGANFVNNGSLSTLSNGVNVTNGSISNTGQINARYLETASDSSIAGFTKGAAYSITNSGIVTGTNGYLQLGANTDYWADHKGTGNDSIGSVINTGTLQVAKGSSLYLAAYSDVSLGGSVKAGTAGVYKALSATNALGSLNVKASDYTDTFGNTAGAGTISTDIVTSNGAFISGNQVKLLANLSSVNATGAPTGDISIVAGPTQVLAKDYAVRIATGKTVTASEIDVNGDTTGDAPNVIVQGTLAADNMVFGSNSPVSDVFTGPTGSLSLLGSAPTLEFDFTGSLKTVAYNNDTSNFRFNGLQVNSAGPLTLTLNPVDYTKNGTSNGLSAVNILVNSDVTLLAPDNTSVTSNGSAVTGVTNIPNTHLVLQSSGNITTGGTGTGVKNFYWPGYVYLGNVTADSDGNALPGTLGMGTITTLGTFNNVLPGDIAGASGIHFITQFPLTFGGEVVTNANALVSFGTDLLTQAYASGTLKGDFFGGVKGSGTVVNYSKLDPSFFATQAPVATR